MRLSVYAMDTFSLDGIFLSTVNVVNVELLMMIVLTKLYRSVLSLVTSTLFYSHCGIKRLKVKVWNQAVERESRISYFLFSSPLFHLFFLSTCELGLWLCCLANHNASIHQHTHVSDFN